MPGVNVVHYVLARVISEPYLSLIILPDKRFWGEVNGHGWSFPQYRRSEPRIAEDNYGPGTQFLAVLFCCSCMIKFGKDHPSLVGARSDRCLKLVDGLFRRVFAGQCGEA